MTNEEKAKELFPEIPNLELVCKGVQNKLVEMAEWKDQQFKEFLVKKYEKYVKANKEDPNNTVAYGKWAAVYDIIDEFFDDIEL